MIRNILYEILKNTHKKNKCNCENELWITKFTDSGSKVNMNNSSVKIDNNKKTNNIIKTLT